MSRLYYRSSKGDRDGRLCLGNGSREPAARPGLGQPVEWARELGVLSSVRRVPGSSGFESVVLCPGSKCRSAGLAAIGNGAAGAANLGHWDICVDIRRDFCLASLARELCLIALVFPVSAPGDSRSCRAGCDLAGMVAGELPTLALDFELRSR